MAIGSGGGGGDAASADSWDYSLYRGTESAAAGFSEPKGAFMGFLTVCIIRYCTGFYCIFGIMHLNLSQIYCFRFLCVHPLELFHVQSTRN